MELIFPGRDLQFELHLVPCVHLSFSPDWLLACLIEVIDNQESLKGVYFQTQFDVLSVISLFIICSPICKTADS